VCLDTPFGRDNQVGVDNAYCTEKCLGGESSPSQRTHPTTCPGARPGVKCTSCWCSSRIILPSRTVVLAASAKRSCGRTVAFVQDAVLGGCMDLLHNLLFLIEKF